MAEQIYLKHRMFPATTATVNMKTEFTVSVNEIT
jgi:hypothetical protein